MKKVTSFLLIGTVAVTIIFGCSLFRGTGTLSLYLTDAPLILENGEVVEQILVTINEVRVSRGVADSDMDTDTEGEPVDPDEDEDTAEWIIITSDPVEYDLMQLQDGVTELLSGESVQLEAGKYNQIRLIVATDNKIVFEGDTTEYDLKIPSGTQSGVKLTGGFLIEEGVETEITLDFDAQESVHSTATGYILKPTIKIQKTGNGGAE